MPIRLPKVHYAWIIVGLSVMLYLVGGAITQAFGVVILPLQDEFGWSRATIAGALTLGTLIMGFGFAFMGPARQAWTTEVPVARRDGVPSSPGETNATSRSSEPSM